MWISLKDDYKDDSRQEGYLWLTGGCLTKYVVHVGPDLAKNSPHSEVTL